MTSAKRPVYVVAGTFDLFHIGHLEILRRTSRLGPVLALVNTDRFVEEFKGKLPLAGQDERSAIVSSLEYVRWSGLNDHADLTKTLDLYLKDFAIRGVVFGDDYDIESYRKQTKITIPWQAEHDVALIQFPRTPGVSTSNLKIKKAQELPEDWPWE